MNIKDCNFNGKKAFVRVDFNVPLEKGKVTDDTRIRGALPTLKKVINDGGRLIIASHLGRPEKNPDEKYSLRQILYKVSELLGVDVKFAPDCAKAQKEVEALRNGEALMLENLRFYAEEEGKPRNLPADITDEQKSAAKKRDERVSKEFCQDSCLLCRLLCERCLRYSPQSTRLYGNYSRLFRQRQ